jgi:hypothetical protein
LNIVGLSFLAGISLEVVPLLRQSLPTEDELMLDKSSLTRMSGF